MDKTPAEYALAWARNKVKNKNNENLFLDDRILDDLKYPFIYLYRRWGAEEATSAFPTAFIFSPPRQPPEHKETITTHEINITRALSQRRRIRRGFLHTYVKPVLHTYVKTGA